MEDVVNMYSFVKRAKQCYQLLQDELSQKIFEARLVSKIYAFEPDPVSYSICEKNLLSKEIRDFHLIPDGLSNRAGEELFRAGLYGGSHIIASGGSEGNAIMVPVTTIDDTVGEDEIGFIKMDIEGAEFDALHGAQKVITRDKPPAGALGISPPGRYARDYGLSARFDSRIPLLAAALQHWACGYCPLCVD